MSAYACSDSVQGSFDKTINQCVHLFTKKLTIVLIVFNSQEISSTFTTSKKTVGGRASSVDVSVSSRPHTWRSSDELQQTYPSVLYIEYTPKSSTQLLSGASYRLTDPNSVFTQDLEIQVLWLSVPKYGFYTHYCACLCVNFCWSCTHEWKT